MLRKEHRFLFTDLKVFDEVIIPRVLTNLAKRCVCETNGLGFYPLIDF